MHHPLICFALAFGARPSRSSLGCELVLPCGRPSLRRLLAKPSTPEHTSLACGSLRRLPMPTYAAASCRLATARRPTGVASPGSSRRLHLPAMSQAGSSMGTSPFRGFSPFAPSWSHAACQNRPPATRTIPPAVSQLTSCTGLATVTRCTLPRLRGFKLDRHGPRCRSPLAIRTDAFSGDGVVHTPDGSLLSWSFPPFEDDLPASSHTSAGHPLMGFNRPCAPAHRLAAPDGPTPTCALQSIREPEVLTRSREPSSVGFLPRRPSP